MSAFISFFKVLELIGVWFNQWREERRTRHLAKLQSDSIAYEKLTKATNARNKNRFSRHASAGRDKPTAHRVRDDKYQRD